MITYFLISNLFLGQITWDQVNAPSPDEFFKEHIRDEIEPHLKTFLLALASITGIKYLLQK